MSAPRLVADRPGPRRFPLVSLVCVRGPSMVPALYPGDRLLARRVNPAAKVRNGTLALVTWSHYPGLVAIKRVIRPDPPGYWVEGDNPYASQDSRSYGPARVLAVVVVRCWPWPPRGPATLRR